MSPETTASTSDPSLLNDEALLDWIDEAAETLAGIAADAEPDTLIPACEGWTMTDLLNHVAPWYSGWYLYNLQHPADDGDLMAAATSAPPMPDDHDGRIVYLRDACAGFTSLARQIDLDAPVWAFWTTQPARLLGQARRHRARRAHVGRGRTPSAFRTASTPPAPPPASTNCCADCGRV